MVSFTFSRFSWENSRQTTWAWVKEKQKTLQTLMYDIGKGLNILKRLGTEKRRGWKHIKSCSSTSYSYQSTWWHEVSSKKLGSPDFTLAVGQAALTQAPFTAYGFLRSSLMTLASCRDLHCRMSFPFTPLEVPAMYFLISQTYSFKCSMEASMAPELSHSA